MKKGQIAYEFLIVLFFLSIAFTSWVMLYNQNQQSVQEQVFFERSEQLAREIQQVSYNVRMLDEGFERKISIPETIIGRSYELTTDSSSVTVQLDGVTSTYALPETNGSFEFGDNFIINTESKICVNLRVENC